MEVGNTHCTPFLCDSHLSPSQPDSLTTPALYKPRTFAQCTFTEWQHVDMHLQGLMCTECVCLCSALYQRQAAATGDNAWLSKCTTPTILYLLPTHTFDALTSAQPVGTRIPQDVVRRAAMHVPVSCHDMNVESGRLHSTGKI
jgi:hypothetical protein